MKNKKCPNCLCTVDPNAQSCPFCKTSLKTKTNAVGILPKNDFHVPEVIAQPVKPLHNTKVTAELPYLPPKKEVEEANVGDFLEVEENQVEAPKAPMTPTIVSIADLKIHESQGAYLEEEEIEPEVVKIDDSSEFDFNGSLMNDIKVYFDMSSPDTELDYEKSHNYIMENLSIDDIVKGSIEADKKEKNNDSFGLMFGQSEEETEELPSYKDIKRDNTNPPEKIYNKTIEKKDYNSYLHDTLDTSLDALGFVDDQSDFKDLKNKLAEPDTTIQSISSNIIEHSPLRLLKKNKDQAVKLNQEKTNQENLSYNFIQSRADMLDEELNKIDPYYYPPFEIDNIEIAEIREPYPETEDLSDESEIDLNPDFLKQLNDFPIVSEQTESIEDNQIEQVETGDLDVNLDEDISDTQEEELIEDKTILGLEDLKLDFETKNQIGDKTEPEEVKEEINSNLSDWFTNEELDQEESEEVPENNLETEENITEQYNAPFFALSDLTMDEKVTVEDIHDTDKSPEDNHLTEDWANNFEISKDFSFNAIPLDSLTKNEIIQEEQPINNLSSSLYLNRNPDNTDLQENLEDEEFTFESPFKDSDNFFELEKLEISEEVKEVTNEVQVIEDDSLVTENYTFDELEDEEGDEEEIEELQNLDFSFDNIISNMNPNNLNEGISIPDFINMEIEANKDEPENIEVVEEVSLSESEDLKNILSKRLENNQEIEDTEAFEQLAIEVPSFLQEINNIEIDTSVIDLIEEDIKANSIPISRFRNVEAENEDFDPENIPDLNQVNNPKNEIVRVENVIEKLLEEKRNVPPPPPVEAKLPPPEKESEEAFNPNVGFQPEPIKMRNPITTTLNTTLGARGTINNEAMDLYISARDLCLKKEYTKALDLLEKSVKIDPAFEIAHILLSRTYLKIKNVY